MNQLHFDTGGRPAANDDLLTLQTRATLLGLPALLLGLGPCVVSGCRVFQTGSQYNLGAGMVWDGTSLLDFSGRSNVSLPAMFAAGPVEVVDERAYQTGGTKPCITEQTMELVPLVAGAPNLVVDTYGALTYWHRVQERTRAAGQVEWLAQLDPAHYDPTGLGLPGTGAWGWGLCNGQGGRADLRGAFVTGYDPDRTDYAAVGKTGGVETVTLTLEELPSHGHPSTNRITKGNKGDAGSYTAALTGSYNEEGKAMSSQLAGGGKAHENRPPYYVLAARQWVGF